MEERKASKRSGGIVFFFVGFVAACVVGWAMVPGWFYEESGPDIRFSHAVHVDGQGMECESCHYYREDGSFNAYMNNEGCAECHYIDPEEAMDAIAEAGLDPSDYDAIMEAQLDVIEDAILSGEEDDRQEEREYLVKYLIQGKEVDWRNFQEQPDNVYYSHAAHMELDIAELAAMKDELSTVVDPSVFEGEAPEQNCNLCHLKDAALSDGSELYKRNILTGYSSMTMKMWKCERCHALMGQSNACFVCHM